VVEEGFIRGRYLNTPPEFTIGAFEGERLVAFTAVQLTYTALEYRATLFGQVHPDFRRRGLGTFLLRWGIPQGHSLLASCPTDAPHILQISTESLTDASTRLYEQYGFRQHFAEDVMRYDLSHPLPQAPFPPGITLSTWETILAEQFFQAYQDAFRDRMGDSPGWEAQQWIHWVTDDEDFLPGLSLLAQQGGQPVGFIVCSAGWIGQVGVRPAWRKQGIGAALVVEVLRRFQERREQQVLLDVNVNNPGATQLYRQLGFREIGRRARYTL
jgi:ribosomal protein S18 acetylase RimI-like enzyme